MGGWEEGEEAGKKERKGEMNESEDGIHVKKRRPKRGNGATRGEGSYLNE